MGSKKIVIDISSDSESSPPFKASRNKKSEWENWDEGGLYDSDVSIIAKKPRSKKRSGATKRRRKNKDSDDDCIILDSNPENDKVEFSIKSPGKKELLVVGERGQVACRDYPHARHLCSQFPFKSTQHRKHCLMCYCYVCDTLAPCLKWDIHCQASDKEDKWKTLRSMCKVTRNFKRAR